ncbi:MAG: exodeoxyribonuclease VII small subunit [Candidatus Omnitrophica bacterium]|nr:exodeoxyribonuclease VII small subunit [Candidatus Omnitrophota bacterium]MBI3009026.1 exodeoxyribonuclease VII small subunit [Candidatus Omnitrophota bacterium]
MAEMKFEDALKKLEKIVSELEGGELSLDESLKRYEEGVKLSRILSKELEAAKKKVEVLVKKDDGKFDLEPFNTGKVNNEN